jgi:putative oxidoreductase
VSYGLLILHVVLGLTMAAHGAQKLFGWFKGYGFAGTSTGFEKVVGFRWPRQLVSLVIVAELGGGIAMMLGFLTTIVCFGFVVVMINAIVTVHWKHGFTLPEGFEFNLLIAACSLLLVASGPGRFSIDHAIGWDDNLSGPWWLLGVFLAAAVTAALTLAVAWRPPPGDASESSGS